MHKIGVIIELWITTSLFFKKIEDFRSNLSFLFVLNFTCPRLKLLISLWFSRNFKNSSLNFKKCCQGGTLYSDLMKFILNFVKFTNFFVFFIFRTKYWFLILFEEILSRILIEIWKIRILGALTASDCDWTDKFLSDFSKKL